MTERVPDVILERYRLGELPAEEVSRIASLVAEDAALRERLAALEQSDAEIRRSGAVRLRAAGTPARTRRWPRTVWLLPAALGAAALLFFAVAPPTPSPDGDRVKGLKPSLALYRRTSAGSESLADGAVAHKGDLVRIGYRAAGHAYGVIFSIDGRGTMTMHLPTSGERAARLQPQGAVLLDASYELDDAPLWERFYFVASDAPFGVTPIVDAVRRATPLPKGLDQFTFSLQKEARP
jgi:hypothetical protein